jgi:hypothetical protein
VFQSISFAIVVCFVTTEYLVEAMDDFRGEIDGRFGLQEDSSNAVVVGLN